MGTLIAANKTMISETNFASVRSVSGAVESPAFMGVSTIFAIGEFAGLRRQAARHEMAQDRAAMNTNIASAR